MLKSPVGTLTFLMTDIEGSTRLWEAEPQAMAKAVLRSEQIIHEVVTEHDGYHAIEQGEGDSTLSVFQTATTAAQAATELRERLSTERWAEGVLIRVRAWLRGGSIGTSGPSGMITSRAARR
jgi:class 3 adenylate cyclase